jgi:hypothetical protein
MFNHAASSDCYPRKSFFVKILCWKIIPLRLFPVEFFKHAFVEINANILLEYNLQYLGNEERPPNDYYFYSLCMCNS